MKISLPFFLFLSFISFGINYSIIAQENIALGKQAGASDITRTKPPYYLTDGDFSTSSEPSASINSLGFYFELDLKEEYPLDKIILHHNKSCDYRIAIYTANFEIPGELVWTADILVHGVDGKDTIRAENSPEGEFMGRYIRITNIDAVKSAPSMAEIEVYESQLPIVNYFETDASSITQSGNPTLPSSANFTWQVSGHSSLTVDQGIGTLPGASGVMNVSPTESTTYTLLASNSYGSVSEEISIAVDSVVIDPVITEFMSSNLATIEDEDGDRSDWIELYNPNNFSLNIKDYHLTDEYTNPAKWKIPSRMIAPRDYIIVFASAKDRTLAGKPLHTNFNMDSEGDYLALVAKDGSTVVQQFPGDYPAHHIFIRQKEDVSYGIDSHAKIGYFDTPTPYQENNLSRDGFVGELRFYRKRGIYTEPIHVAMACTTPGATIRYTRDGSEPTETSGFVFSDQLLLSTNTIVRARAFKPGLIPTKTMTHSYIFIDDVVHSDVMDKTITGVSDYKAKIEMGLAELPSISIVVDESVNTVNEVATSMEWIDPIKNEDLQVNAGIINYGGAFTHFAKKNFRLYFRGVYGDTKLYHPLFEGFDHSVPAVDRFDQLDLRAGGHDMSMRGFYMSNRFADDLMLESGHLNPHGRFVNLYFNGVYWGQYHLRERWNDAMFAEYFGAENEEFEAINGNLNLGGWSTREKIYAGDGSAWENVKSLRDNYIGVKDYLDVPQYINFMVFFMYGRCENEFKAVGSINPGNGFKFYMNDADGFTRSTGNRTGMDQPGKKPADGPGSIFSMLLKEAHPDYMTLLADQIHDLLFNDGVLTPNRITSIMNERCAEVQNSIVAESARWGYRSPSNWDSAKNTYITEVLPLRSGTLLKQFIAAGFYPGIDAPIYSQHGGLVPRGYALTMSSNTNTIYYTTDGSDPRLPGGNISDDAVRYSNTSEEAENFTLVGANSNVSALVPSGPALSIEWTAEGFTESEDWIKNIGGAGVGYDQESTYTSHIDLPLLNEMFGVNSSVYLRYAFEINDPSEFESLELKMKCDDGFVAYLNGEIFASVNAPSILDWNSSATSNYGDDSAVVFIPVAITHGNVSSLLKEGTNVLAIHGLNRNPTSTDFLIEPEFTGLKNNTSNGMDSVLIDEPVNIMARAYDGGIWSALSQASFVLPDDTVNYDSPTMEEEAGIIIRQFPNPFREQTTISFMVSHGTESILEVFDILGKSLWRKEFSIEKGREYSEVIDASLWKSGLYFYRIVTNTGIVKTGKMMHSK